MKTAILELLLQLTKQRKNIPLTLDQKVKLVQVLLHDRVKHFDFAVFGLTDPTSTRYRNISNALVFKYQEIYNEIWSELADKCHNLLEIRSIFPGSVAIELNHKAFDFPKLTCLETNCFITEGEQQSYFCISKETLLMDIHDIKNV